MKKNISVFIIILLLFFTNGLSVASISITGTVKQPLNLSRGDLSGFKNIRVQLNEVLKDGSYRGAWFYTGVPVKTLLETACIEKEESAFSKRIGLAILVRNSEGQEVALSWGEIFYKQESNVIIATSGSAIRPHHGCNSCHEPEVLDKYMKQLDREVGFPKLVVTGDVYADRSIENVVSIEVINPTARMPEDKSAELFSPSFVVTGDVKKELTFKNLVGFSRKDMTFIHMGEGRGFHGIDQYSGVLFTDIVNKAGIEPGLSKIFIISAPDGYRTSFSYGEIFLNRVEDNVIIADEKNGEKIDKEGKFVFVPTDDLMADRDIKSVEKIELIDLKTKPKLTYIGTGPGDTDLLTMEAVTAMSRADIFICSTDIKKRFGKYMGDKTVLLDLYDFVKPVIIKQNPGITLEELNKKLEENRSKIASKIKAELKKGKHVAILDYGDVTIWSAAEYIMEHFNRDMIEIIPGLSSFNVASALLSGHTGCRGSIILTTLKGILYNKPLFKEAARKGETLSIFMAKNDLPKLVDFFKSVYETETPVNVVYRAGYSASEKVVRTDLDGLQKTIDSEKEKNLFLVFIGPCLESAKAHRH